VLPLNAPNDAVLAMLVHEPRCLARTDAERPLKQRRAAPRRRITISTAWLVERVSFAELLADLAPPRWLRLHLLASFSSQNSYRSSRLGCYCPHAHRTSISSSSTSATRNPGASRHACLAWATCVSCQPRDDSRPGAYVDEEEIDRVVGVHRNRDADYLAIC